MGFDLRMPNITATTERDQLAQIKSYLYQFIPQLQWALNTLQSSTPAEYVVRQTPKSLTSNYDLMPLGTDDEDEPTVDFEELKSLIIKSADIVDAYYEEISSRLTSVYVAQSDFGTFVEENEQEISQSSTATEQLFTNIQKIATDIEKLNYTLAEVNAHIKSGLLYYEGGIPVYGLEIGQKNIVDGAEVFNKYARFTSDRLCFYDQNDTEVAYISDYKIHITHAEVAGTLKLGGYLVDTTRGLTFKWVGRS